MWQEDIALNEHSYQQQLQQYGLIAALHSFAEIAIAVRGLALKGWIKTKQKRVMGVILRDT